MRRTIVGVALLAGMALSGCESGGLPWARGELIGERITFPRPDGTTLVAQLAFAEAERAPAVLLLHQAQSRKEEFAFLAPEFRARGFHTLALDLRGHGESAGNTKRNRAFFRKIFYDPEFAPPDVFAVLEWMKVHPRIDPERIGAVGGSLGANLAFVVSERPEVVAAVALSGEVEMAVELAGGAEGFEPAGVFAISGDRDGDRAAHARAIYESSGEPRRLEIIEGSGAHGVSLLRRNEALRKDVVDWIAAGLER